MPGSTTRDLEREATIDGDHVAQVRRSRSSSRILRCQRQVILIGKVSVTDRFPFGDAAGGIVGELDAAILAQAALEVLADDLHWNAHSVESVGFVGTERASEGSCAVFAVPAVRTASASRVTVWTLISRVVVQ